MMSLSTRCLPVIAVLVLGVNAYLETAPNNNDTNQCGLQGVWINQLQSSFEILWCTEGHVAGRYNSAVGNAENFYDLSGKYTWGAKAATNTTVVLAWTVSYNNAVYGNSESVCAWSGLYYEADAKIYTHWILSRAVERDDYWKAKNLNDDVFHRQVLTTAPPP